MKNIFFTICICLAAMPAAAQFGLGPIVGIHSRHTNFTYDPDRSLEFPETNFSLGIVSDIGLGKDLSLRPCVTLGELYLSVGVVEVTSNITYKMHVGPKSFFFAGAGPYITFTTARKGAFPFEHNVKTMNVGGLLNIGFQHLGVFASAFYQPLFTSPPIKEFNTVFGSELSAQHRSLGVSVGFVHTFGMKEERHKANKELYKQQQRKKQMKNKKK